MEHNRRKGLGSSRFCVHICIAFQLTLLLTKQAVGESYNAERNTTNVPEREGDGLDVNNNYQPVRANQSEASSIVDAQSPRSPQEEYSKDFNQGESQMPQDGTKDDTFSGNSAENSTGNLTGNSTDIPTDNSTESPGTAARKKAKVLTSKLMGSLAMAYMVICIILAIKAGPLITF